MLCWIYGQRVKQTTPQRGTSDQDKTGYALRTTMKTQLDDCSQHEIRCDKHGKS